MVPASRLILLGLVATVLLILELTEGAEQVMGLDVVNPSETSMAIHPLAQVIDCKSACNGRCAKSGRPKRCLKCCNICCGKCSCVPPGTYGNKEMCPCYNNMKNSKGTSKCP